MPVQHDLTPKLGPVVTLTFPEPRQGPSVFVIAGHKTGSVLLNNIIRDLARLVPMPTVAVEAEFFRLGIGIESWPDEVFDILDCDGLIFHSFRELQRLPEIKSFGRARKIFMVRDPRDIAVSFYYSMAASHVVPENGALRDQILTRRDAANTLSIDGFIQAGHVDYFLRNVESFADFLIAPNTTFYRYEDVIFEKPGWVQQIALDLGLDVAKGKTDWIAKQHDKRPEQENPGAHIRAVTPGQFRQKLSGQTIRYIETNFPRFFLEMGYREEG